MAKVWKRRDRDVWVADFRDAGGIRRRLMARTRQAAEELLAKGIKELREPAPASEDRDITLAEYAARWLAAAEHELAPKTFRSYRQLLELHVLPKLGRLRLHE